MDALDLEPQISLNRRGVIFALTWKHGSVECVISRTTLETHFWLPTDADDAKMLKTFTMAPTVAACAPAARLD